MDVGSITQGVCRAKGAGRAEGEPRNRAAQVEWESPLEYWGTWGERCPIPRGTVMPQRLSKIKSENCSLDSASKISSRP